MHQTRDHELSRTHDSPPRLGDAERRRAQTVARTLRSADEAAARGEFADALGWIEVLRSLGDPLPDDYDRKRATWMRELRCQQATEASASGDPPAPLGLA
jgi:hypothetical protein